MKASTTGAVDYNPKVVTTREGIRVHIREEAKPFTNMVLRLSCGAHLVALLAEEIDFGGNTDPAVVRAAHRSIGRRCSIAINYTDLAWRWLVIPPTSGEVRSLNQPRDWVPPRNDGHKPRRAGCRAQGQPT